MHLSAHTPRPLADRRVLRARRAFNLLELLIVIMIIGYLIALLMPALSAAQSISQRTLCAANLRQLGIATQIYASSNSNWVPRDATLGRPDRPPWPMLLGPLLGTKPDLTVDDLPEIKVFQCPSHPMENIPTGYVINAFAFETAPDWRPDGPIHITSLIRTSDLPWMFDAADDFPFHAPPLEDKIFGVEFHDVYDPAHLPTGDRHRISDDRHWSHTANVLYLDGHVDLIHVGELRLEMMDDHVLRRATSMPSSTGAP